VRDRQAPIGMCRTSTPLGSNGNASTATPAALEDVPIVGHGLGDVDVVVLGYGGGVAQLAGRALWVVVLGVDMAASLRKVRGVIHAKVLPRAARQILAKLLGCAVSRPGMGTAVPSGSGARRF
jgi:hypothetical protein